MIGGHDFRYVVFDDYANFIPAPVQLTDEDLDKTHSRYRYKPMPGERRRCRLDRSKVKAARKARHRR